jgi:ribulose-5-phosphate 4-epimerase/fuculose-1-phosphate aldolase
MEPPAVKSELLCNHGTLSGGPNLIVAFEVALHTEILAKTYLMAKQADACRAHREAGGKIPIVHANT